MNVFVIFRIKFEMRQNNVPFTVREISFCIKTEDKVDDWINSMECVKCNMSCILRCAVVVEYNYKAVTASNYILCNLMDLSLR